MLEYAIKDILNKATGLKVSPVYGTDKPPFLTYTMAPIDGGNVKQTQVEVKIISSDFDECLEIREKILKELDMIERVPSIVNHGIVLRSGLGGGGSIFNDEIQMWELSCIFIITWRWQ